MTARLKLKSVIAVTASVVALYPLGILVESPPSWLFLLFCLATGATVWMVVRILRDPYSTEKMFDDYLYQDRSDIRRLGKE